MYRIVKTDGTELGFTDSVLFIKISAEGSFIESSKEDAIGIAFDGVAYNLFGHTEIEQADTVIISETPFWNMVKEQNGRTDKLQANLDYLAMMSDVDFEEGNEEPVEVASVEEV